MPLPKPLVENTPIALDFLDPVWKDAMGRDEATGSCEWRVWGRTVGSARWYLGIPHGDGTRELTLVFDGGTGIHIEALTIEPVQVGFSSRWHARCPAECGRRAQKLYFVTARSRFACWRCSGLQYTTAAKHNARVYQLAADPEALIAEMERVNRLGLASVGVMRAMERCLPNQFGR